ncbi:collagen alpha-1(I) chain-like [Panthera pardus]|uniref:Collagen alpha-1(I) chain-like n=1 Tax=Panthera pardus TaxID=9691 RepID=A0A9W2VVS3_PANPR|nr:collagen alpha-1(I) chain-like [Panthera pardus]
MPHRSPGPGPRSDVCSPKDEGLGLGGPTGSGVDCTRGGGRTLLSRGRARRSSSGGGAARCPAGGRPVCAARAACGRDEDCPPRPERRGRRGRAGSSIVSASAANGAGPSEREVSVAARRPGSARGPGVCAAGHLAARDPPRPGRPRRRAAPAGPGDPPRGPPPRPDPARPARDATRRERQGAPGARRGPRRFEAGLRPARRRSRSPGRPRGALRKVQPSARRCVPAGAAERGLRKAGPPGSGAGAGARARPRAGSFIAGRSGCPHPHPHPRSPAAASSGLPPGRAAPALGRARAGRGGSGGSARARAGLSGARGSPPLRSCGEATRRPHPARAPGRPGAPRESGRRDPWGRGAARRRPEGKASRGSRGLPAVTQTLPPRPGPRRQRGRRDRRSFAWAGLLRSGGGLEGEQRGRGDPSEPPASARALAARPGLGSDAPRGPGEAAFRAQLDPRDGGRRGAEAAGPASKRANPDFPQAALSRAPQGPGDPIAEGLEEGLRKAAWTPLAQLSGHRASQARAVRDSGKAPRCGQPWGLGRKGLAVCYRRRQEKQGASSPVSPPSSPVPPPDSPVPPQLPAPPSCSPVPPPGSPVVALHPLASLPWDLGHTASLLAQVFPGGEMAPHPSTWRQTVPGPATFRNMCPRPREVVVGRSRPVAPIGQGTRCVQTATGRPSRHVSLKVTTLSYPSWARSPGAGSRKRQVGAARRPRGLGWPGAALGLVFTAGACAPSLGRPRPETAVFPVLDEFVSLPVIVAQRTHHVSGPERVCKESLSPTWPCSPLPPASDLPKLVSTAPCVTNGREPRVSRGPQAGGRCPRSHEPASPVGSSVMASTLLLNLLIQAERLALGTQHNYSEAQSWRGAGGRVVKQGLRERVRLA